MLTNPLYEIIPAKARKYVYGLAFLAGLLWTLWQASEGDWKEFVGALVATLIPLLAASNTAVKSPPQRNLLGKQVR